MDKSQLELLAAMQEMMKPLQDKLDVLEQENKKLREEVETPSAGSIPNTAGRPTNMRTARSVTIATRPVQDNPDDPRWAGKVATSTVRAQEDE